MPFHIRHWFQFILLFLPLFTFGCSSHIGRETSFDSESRLTFDDSSIVPGGSKPRFVGGIEFHSKQHSGDNIGLAGRYGQERVGQVTANGEINDPQNLFAAHPSLALSSYVEISNLDTGRRLTLRVNDRSDGEDDHIIIVSERSAELLGFGRLQSARVRIRYLGPAPLQRIGRFD